MWGIVCPPAQEFGKRGGVFRILMPTAPTRIKLSPAPLSLLPLLSLTLPLIFRNPTLQHKTAPHPSVIIPTSFTGVPLFGDFFALPVRLRPPEMGIVAGIGVVWRYWEGGFVCGG